MVFKLKNGILEASELAKEKGFLAHLLEWFNFEEWAMESQVLNLLSQLSEVGGDSNTDNTMHESTVETPNRG